MFTKLPVNIINRIAAYTGRPWCLRVNKFMREIIKGMPVRITKNIYLPALYPYKPEGYFKNVEIYFVQYYCIIDVARILPANCIIIWLESYLSNLKIFKNKKIIAVLNAALVNLI